MITWHQHVFILDWMRVYFIYSNFLFFIIYILTFYYVGIPCAIFLFSRFLKLGLTFECFSLWLCRPHISTIQYLYISETLHFISWFLNVVPIFDVPQYNIYTLVTNLWFFSLFLKVVQTFKCCILWLSRTYVYKIHRECMYKCNFSQL